MGDEPLVSVVMSVYNAEKYLHEAIASILAQTYRNFEFIIVNDGSRDSTLKIIEEFEDPRIVLLNQSNTGLSKALNNGIAISKGDFIARMDGDDISHPERLALQVRFLLDNPECIVVGANANFIDMDGNFLYKSCCPCSWSDIKRILPESPFFHSATMFRRAEFINVGGYFEAVRQFFEDQILWNRLAQIGQLRNLEPILLDYRIVPGSITGDKVGSIDFKKIAEKVIRTNSVDPADIEIINSARSVKITARVRNGVYFLRLGKIYLEHNFRRGIAIKMLIRSLLSNPFVAVTWFNLVLSLFPRRVIFRWKTSRRVYQKIW